MSSRSPRQLPPEVAERLGPFYVYVLVDPRDESVFYVGKGTGERLLAHGREADLIVDESIRSSKVAKIRELRDLGCEPRIDIVRHGLREDEALLIEAALIDCLDHLTNRVAGHGTAVGRSPLDELATRYGASAVPTDAPPALLIRLGRWRDAPEEIEPGTWRAGNGYRSGMSPSELADSARAWWKINPETLARHGILHAVAVHDGVTRGVMEIGDWERRNDGRRAFSAQALNEGPIAETWVGPFGRQVEFTVAAQNPIRYWLPER
ncbi:MAG: hypothetical protein O3C27_02960 [Actinomycetota bacterium]|nr:hypothetical protein [Actinomycetota bacterium]